MRGWRRVVLAGMVGLYLVTLGFVGGLAAERIRYSRDRAAALGRHEGALSAWRAERMRLERETAPTR